MNENDSGELSHFIDKHKIAHKYVAVSFSFFVFAILYCNPHPGLSLYLGINTVFMPK